MAMQEWGEPAQPVRNVYFGTCGWTEPTLVRAHTFYPPGASTAEARLRYYATRFPLVEVDSTFYAPPTEDNAKRWVERTPDGFVFDVKAHALLTHHPARPKMLGEELRRLLPDEVRDKARIYRNALPDEALELLWDQHVNALKPLAEAGKLGAVLFQFPFWFTSNRDNRLYLHELAARLPYRIAVEFRGGGWMENGRRRDTLALLEHLGFTYVCVDGPQGSRSSTPPVIAQTAELAMFRFLGRNAETFESPQPSAAARFDYLYEPAELAPWARAASQLSPHAEAVHALMNNCYRDYAVRNAFDFADLVARGVPHEVREHAH